MRRLTQFILFSLILFSLIYVVMFSSLLTIKHVEIDGTTLPNELVMDLAGAKVGNNLLLYRTENGIQRLMQDARIESASMKKQWPDTLHIEVVSRVPFVNINDGANTITLDKTGLVIEINQPNANLIQMTGFTISQASLGEPIVSPEAATLKKALDLANLVGQTNLVGPLITYEKSQIMLKLGEQWRIRFGSANQIEEQFSVFKAMYDKLSEQGTTGGTIDVTNAEIAVFEPFE